MKRYTPVYTTAYTKFKKLYVDLQNRIVSRHRSAEGYRSIFAASKVQISTVAFIIREWKMFGTTWNFQRTGNKQTVQLGEKGLRQKSDQEPDGDSDKAPAFLCGEKKQLSMQHFTNQACMVKWHDESYSPVKDTWQPAWSFKKNT